MAVTAFTFNLYK